MQTIGLEPLIAALQAWPPEAIWPLMALACFGGQLILLRLFGAMGLAACVVVGILAANLQVLKVVPFGSIGPVAEGTIVFASTFLATDILAEHYGRRVATRVIWLGFASYLLFTVLMVLALGFRPLTPETVPEGYDWALPMHGHLAALFTPAPALFVAGMTSYLVSQFLDITLFFRIRGWTRARMPWARNILSTAVSGLVDNTVFSTLAFVVLAAEPVPLDALIFSYILGTYWQRLALALLDTPFFYLSWRARPAADRAVAAA
jgi:uncharacterized integral membrane protein (TIGR00697 family)